MKGIGISCVSQASTAICAITELSSSAPAPASASATSSSSSAAAAAAGGCQSLGGRLIDRQNPIIRDGSRVSRATLTAGCTSDELPNRPTPEDQNRARRKKNAEKLTGLREKSNVKPDCKERDQNQRRRKSFSMPSDLIFKGCIARPGIHYISPLESSRYLLDDPSFRDGVSGLDPDLMVVPCDSKKAEVAAKAPTPPSAAPSNQVVVLRVSLHCKGCEGKVRKHISRMEGVTSFNIDFASKKVTIVGDVTPLGVLASISKFGLSIHLTNPSRHSETLAGYFRELCCRFGLGWI
ncbi:hypothetical protein Nepgr_001507 [Nepenthes gracilis]|uniref:HMA domain-containing protein n=1 Tax=Nepenthes gracilis TaxID=150966 RepID=A0AAD3P590_NEPGR|nr:hypothetical protein Nepgr_001507 [Nepenthes gracilis]